MLQKIYFKRILRVKLSIYMSLGFRETALSQSHGDVGRHQNSRRARAEYRRLAALGVTQTQADVKSYQIAFEIPTRALTHTRLVRGPRARIGSVNRVSGGPVTYARQT